MIEFHSVFDGIPPFRLVFNNVEFVNAPSAGQLWKSERRKNRERSVSQGSNTSTISGTISRTLVVMLFKSVDLVP